MFNEEKLIESLPDIWIISDTHFYHKNIGRYCNRPENWFDLIINNWNKVVDNNDIVLHLGDFIFRGFDQAKNVKNRLNGEIYLIKGNHDRHSKKWYSKLDINLITPFKAEIDNQKYFFSHKPQKRLEYGISNIHGHWHDKCPFTWYTKNGNINFNLSVEVIGYQPIKLKDVIKYRY